MRKLDRKSFVPYSNLKCHGYKYLVALSAVTGTVQTGRTKNNATIKHWVFTWEIKKKTSRADSIPRRIDVFPGETNSGTAD